MQQFKEKLKKLVSDNAFLVNGVYTSSTKNLNLQVLESSFILLVAETLSAPPLTQESINKIAKQLFLQFHSDKKASYSPEIHWLEATLSKGLNNGACFKIITFCKERLLTPNDNKGDAFEKAENFDDIKAIFEQLKKNSSTHIQIAFYDSLISFINECTTYNKKIDDIQYSKIKLAMKYLPLCCPHQLVAIFHAEIIALYAVSALSTLLGYSIQQFGGESLNELGTSMVDAGFFGLTSTSIALIRIYEMSYWFCGNSYEIALQTSAVLLNTLNPSDSKFLPYTFQTTALKNVVRPFETYLQQNGQQFFREARIGATKRQAVLNLLDNARLIDKQPLADEEKLNHFKLAIDNLALMSKINTQSLAKTIRASYFLLRDQNKPLLLMN